LDPREAAERRKKGQAREHVHRTRMVPKRADELTDGGSLYWVIRGQVMCRQKLTDVRPYVDKAGIGRCELVLEPKVIAVEPRPWRAFQGWRYLEPKDSLATRPRRARRQEHARDDATGVAGTRPAVTARDSGSRQVTPRYCRSGASCRSWPRPEA